MTNEIFTDEEKLALKSTNKKFKKEKGMVNL